MDRVREKKRILADRETRELVEELVAREAVDYVRVKPHHPYEVAVIKDLDALKRKDYKSAYATDKPMHMNTEEGPCIIIVVWD